MELDPATLAHTDAYKLLIGSVLPRPIAWVSTVDKKGVPNLAPFSFFMAVCSNPFTVAFAPTVKPDGTAKDTLRNIRETQEFVVNLVSEPFAAAMNMTSKDFPPGVNEFREAKVTEIPSVKVRPPRVKESPIQMECKLHSIVDVGSGPGSGSLILGTVVLFSCRDDLMHEGKIDLKKLQLIGRLSGAYYVRTNNDIFEIARPQK